MAIEISENDNIQNSNEQSSEDQSNKETIDTGIIVRKLKDENGNVSVDAQPFGSCELAEVPTLLKIAAKTFENKLGI